MSKKLEVPLDQKLLWSVQEFCTAAGISRQYFYQMMREGNAPEWVMLGKRRMIPAERAKAWVEKKLAANS